MSRFLDNFYGTLFCPNRTFDKIREKPPLFQAFLIVLAVSILFPVINFKLFDGTLSLVWFTLSIFGSIFFCILNWLSFAFFLDLVASIFSQSGKIKIFLTLSAFALIPWIFLGPVELLRTGGILGGILAIFLGLTICIWTVILIIKAVSRSYQLSFGRTLIFIIVPFLGSSLAFYLIVIFFSTLFQILKA